MDPDPALRAELRRAVFALRQRERGRTFGPRIHVGRPDDQEGSTASPDATRDHGLRTEVVARLLRWAPEDGPVGSWLTRTGEPVPHDVDPWWHAAARSAFGEAGVELAFFVVVTKRGWYSPATGEQARWKRLRIR